MKKIAMILIISMSMAACAGQQRYTIPTGKTNTDFLEEREVCSAASGYSGGGFLFGPLIIILPIFIVLEIIKGQNQKAFEKCMIERGYTCNEGCWNPKTDMIAVRPAGQESYNVAQEARPPLSPAGESSPGLVRSAVGESGRDGRFISYSDGTVLDTRTKLMWAAKDNGADINWQNAKNYCESYRGGGYTDWRMPTQIELMGLYNKNKPRPMACETSNTNRVETGLIDISCYYVWASETGSSFFRSTAAFFGFYDGDRAYYRQSYNSYMRALPVRSGK